MTTVNDVTDSLNAMHLADTTEWIAADMEIDNFPQRGMKGAPSETKLDAEMDVTLSEGERKTYEIYVECCSDDEAEAMEIYFSIMKDVVDSHENAIAVLASSMHTMNCFFVNLTRLELEKLVATDNERIRGIYPPYRPV